MESGNTSETAVSDVSVQVISPNLSNEGAVERVDPDGDVDGDDVHLVGYPKFLFDYCCSLNRMFLSDRKVSLSITVNGITGGRLRNDAYPELETRTISSDALLQPRLTRGDAIEKARSVIRKYLSFHYSTYVLISGMPETEIRREEMAYNLYWIVPETAADSSSVSIVDSISGEIIDEGIQTAPFSGMECP